MSALRNIPERVRCECIRRGWSLQDLARRAGLSRSTFYHLEQGHTARPQTKTLQKIASALEMDIAELLAEPESAIRATGSRSTDAIGVASRDVPTPTDATAARDREIIEKLQDVLDSPVREQAVQLIELLHRMSQPAR